MLGNHEELSLSEKRKTVYDLLRQKKPDEAYDLAIQFDLHDPWKALCAYRLAHFKMLNDTDSHAINEAKKLFLEAAAAHYLGPLPLIYRLAALERLHIKDPKEMKNAFEAALYAVKHWPVSDRLQNEKEYQLHYWNMVLLAAYYFGYKSESIKDITPLITDASWILVGHDSKLAGPRLPRNFIFEEMEALSRMYPKAVFFRLSKKDQPTEDTLEREWKVGSGPWQPMPHYASLRLLSLLLRGSPGTIEGLKAALGATGNAFSQIKRRLKKAFSALTDIPEPDVFFSERGQFPRLNPDVAIFGAVEI